MIPQIQRQIDASIQTLFTNTSYPCLCCDPSQWREVRKLNEMKYRKWMVLIGAGMLLIAIIRLWIGI